MGTKYIEIASRTPTFLADSSCDLARGCPEASLLVFIRVQNQQALVCHVVRPTTNSAASRACETPDTRAIPSEPYSPDREYELHSSR